MTRSLVLTALFSVCVCACARGTPPTASGSAAPNAPPTTAQTQAPQGAGSAQVAPTQSETEQATAAQETGGEDAEVTRGDTSLEHLAALPADQQLPGGKWKAGVNYDPLVPSQPTSVGPGKVEVVEVFWLGCPHCYALEPFVTGWLKTKPDYIEFVRVPVMWGPVHRAHAHLYYTLLALNRADLFEKAFDTIQQQHQMLVANSEDETLKLQMGFATANGITADAFMKAYNSFTVSSNLARAEQLTQRYHVEGVPLIVVNGKYTTDVSKAGSPQDLFRVVDDLAASEHKH
jgi:protein dithiol oxidoreductase (disulfide-forming)